MSKLSITRRAGESVHLFVNGEEIIVEIKRVDHRTPPQAQLNFYASKSVRIERAERLEKGKKCHVTPTPVITHRHKKMLIERKRSVIKKPNSTPKVVATTALPT